MRNAESIAVDYHEADVWSYHGRLEVRHEKTLKRLPVRWDRWKLEYRGHPRLEVEALIELWQGPGTLMLDLKGLDQSMPERILRTIEQRRPELPIAFCARNWRLLMPFVGREATPLLPSVGGEKDIVSLQSAPRVEWSGVSVHADRVSAPMLERLRTFGPAIITWPINSEPVMERVVEAGVDGIISDRLSILSIAARRYRAEAR